MSQPAAAPKGASPDLTVTLRLASPMQRAMLALLLAGQDAVECDFDALETVSPGEMPRVLLTLYPAPGAALAPVVDLAGPAGIVPGQSAAPFAAPTSGLDVADLDHARTIHTLDADHEADVTDAVRDIAASIAACPTRARSTPPSAASPTPHERWRDDQAFPTLGRWRPAFHRAGACDPHSTRSARRGRPRRCNPAHRRRPGLARARQAVRPRPRRRHQDALLAAAGSAEPQRRPVMPFVEIVPVRKTAGTGVRMSNTERGGLTISLSGEALAALGMPQAGVAARVLFDADPVAPRVRILMAPDGAAVLRGSPGRGKVRNTLMCRLGRQTHVAPQLSEPLACTWEPVSGDGSAPAIDIDVPREMRPIATAVSRPTNSAGNPGRAVTLPKVSA